MVEKMGGKINHMKATLKDITTKGNEEEAQTSNTTSPRPK